ncbi:MAG: penicillin acylase family protein, partial [Bacteroidetes bacterium]
MRKIWLLLPLILVGLLLAAAGGGYTWLQQSKPRYEGEQALPGLAADVEVRFDQHGIPHIYAGTEVDAYRALGYVQAQDRLFQMELLRRLAAGRLAEVLGPDLLEVDIFFRTLGIHEQSVRQAKALMQGPDTPWREALLAYLDGVNTF